MQKSEIISRSDQNLEPVLQSLSLEPVLHLNTCLEERYIPQMILTRSFMTHERTGIAVAVDIRNEIATT